MIRSAFLVIVTLAIASSPVLANIGMVAIERGGTVLQPKIADAPVAMVWEEVDLYPALKKMAVKAVFGLKNVGEKDVTLEVGFPVFAKDEFKDFIVSIDGGEKPEVRKVLAAKIDPKHSDDKDTTMPDNAPLERNFAAWMCWTLTFPAGKERRVEVTYWFTPEVTDHLQLPKVKWLAELQEQMAWRRGYYIVRTGRGWAGNIGRGVFRVHWSNEVPKAKVRGLAPPWSSGGDFPAKWQYDPKADMDTLTLKDFEPDYRYDIGFAFKTVTVAEEAALLTDAIKKRQLGGYRSCSNPAMDHLVGLIDPSWDPSWRRYSSHPAPDLLGLSEKERKARLIEVLEYCVPPLGPGGFEKDIESGAHGGLTGSLIYRAFKTLFAHYQETGQNKKAAALAPHYKATLRAMLKFCHKELAGINSFFDDDREAWLKTTKELEDAYSNLLQFMNRKPEK